MKNTLSVNPIRWWDLPSVLLLLIILTLAFTRLTVTQWAENLDITRQIVYLGLVAGLALGYSRFSPRLTALFGLVYGIFIVTWRLGLTLKGDIAWTERLQSLAGRLRVIFSYLSQQRAVPDNLLFLLLMSALFWFISLYASYTLIRHANPWVAALPSGLTIVMIHTYDPTPRRVWYLVIYLFLTLLLVARLYYVGQRRRWEQNRTYMPSYLGTDIIRFALVACLVLVALSWSTPALAKALPAAKNSWDRVVTPRWNNARNVFENAFSSLRSTIGLTGEYYGPNLSLGRGTFLGDIVIFTVQTATPPPQGMRYYWRARVYDTYNESWSSTLQTGVALDAQGINLKFPDMADNPPGDTSFTFYLNRPIATILAPNQPVWLSRLSRAELAYNPDGTADLGSLRATPSLRAGEIYSVRSSLNVVSVAKLREAGHDYPEWVKERYLQLPETITPRTRQLASQIAEGKETPYDVAQAVTNYLRENYKYSETVPLLPTDQDLVDWFLFDLKQGFCNYYASAEVILLRSAGVPARLAVGYAQGENVDNPEFYTVRQRDAHAWPEVYFPGIGWIEFEPTVSQPAIVRPQEINGSDNPLNPINQGLSLNNLEPEPPLRRETSAENLSLAEIWKTRLAVILAVGLSLVLIALLVPLIRKRQYHKKLPLLPIFLEKAMMRVGLKPPRFLRELALMASLSPLERAYQQINLALVRLGRRPAPMLTPAERADSLIEKLPPTRDPAQIVLSEYHRAAYSPKANADQLSAQLAGDEIRRLSFRAIIRRRFGI